jgi:hypothetical protein
MGYTKGRFITLFISGKYSLSLGISTNQHAHCYYCYNLNKASTLTSPPLVVKQGQS